MNFAIVIPSMGRPEQLMRCIRSCEQNKRAARVSYYIGLECDDPVLMHYRAQLDRALLSYTVFDTPGRGGRIWRELALQAANDGADYIMLCSDDIVFETPNWDTLIEGFAVPNRHLPHFVFGNDGSCGDRHATHPFLSASWVRTVGAMPNCIEHYEGDTFITALGKATGRGFFIPQLWTRHMAVKYGAQSPDATSESLPPVRQDDHKRYWSKEGQEEYRAALEKLQKSFV